MSKLKDMADKKPAQPTTTPTVSVDVSKDSKLKSMADKKVADAPKTQMEQIKVTPAKTPNPIEQGRTI